MPECNGRDSALRARALQCGHVVAAIVPISIVGRQCLLGQNRATFLPQVHAWDEALRLLLLRTEADRMRQN